MAFPATTKRLGHLGGVDTAIKTPFVDRLDAMSYPQLPPADFTHDTVYAGSLPVYDLGTTTVTATRLPPVAEREAKATFSLENFMSRVKDDSFARLNRYEVQIPSCPGTKNTDTIKLVNMYCEQSQLPMLNINTKPLRIYGPMYQRATGIDFGGEGLVMQFYLDRDMKIKRVFDNWMAYIVDTNTYHVQYPDNYIRNIMINQLDERNNITYAVKLIDAFPRTQQLLQLDYSGEGIHRLQVSFSYRKWEYVDPRSPVTSVEKKETPKTTKTPTQQRNKTVSPLMPTFQDPRLPKRSTECANCHEK